MKNNSRIIVLGVIAFALLFLLLTTCNSCKSYNALKLECAQKDITIGQYQEREKTYIDREKDYQGQIRILNDTIIKATERIERLVTENGELMENNYNLTKEVSKKQDSLSILIPMIKKMPDVFIRILKDKAVISVDYDKKEGWIYNY